MLISISLLLLACIVVLFIICFILKQRLESTMQVVKTLKDNRRNLEFELQTHHNNIDDLYNTIIKFRLKTDSKIDDINNKINLLRNSENTKNYF
jgi:predicted Holliday junction resolvase-like endonuclease